MIENSLLRALKEDGNMVEVSVTIPMLQTKYIGWLILESLARQEKIDFEWELIIAEEKKYSPMGWEEISSYKSRLESIGCVRLIYISLDEWIPLGTKVKIMIQACNPKSHVWINSDADQYIPFIYLKTAKEAIENNDVDCFRTEKWILYDIMSEGLELFDIKDFPGRLDQSIFVTPFNHAAKIDISNSLNYGWQVFHSIKDRSLKNQDISNSPFFVPEVGLRVYKDQTDNWKYGLNVTGLNNCTTSRPFHCHYPPFYICPVDIKETIPADILQHLKDCKQYAKDFQRGLHTKKHEELYKK